MSRIANIRNMARKAGGWVKPTHYPNNSNFLVYNPSTEELVVTNAEQVCEGAQWLWRLAPEMADNGGRAVALDRYNRENTRGNYIRMYRDHETSSLVHLDEIGDASAVPPEVRDAAHVIWQYRPAALDVAKNLRGQITEATVPGDEWLEEYGIKPSSYRWRLDLKDDSPEAQEVEEWITPGGVMSVGLSASDWARVLWMLGLATDEDIKANHMDPKARALLHFIDAEGEVQVPVYKSHWLTESWDGLLERGATVVRTGFLNTYGGE